MWIVVWFILALLVGIYASNKGLSGFLYFVLSLVLSPLVAVLIAAVSQHMLRTFGGGAGVTGAIAFARIKTQFLAAILSRRRRNGPRGRLPSSRARSSWAFHASTRVVSALAFS
jgi:hypothetical protein